VAETLERIASSLFSATVFRPVLQGSSGIRANQLASHLTHALDLGRDATNGAVVDAAYEVLCESYRSEYFYRNLIVNKIYVGRHRASNSALIPEFRVHQSVADCVLVNGEATVYEIKTEFDSPDKLQRQLSSYFRAFSVVNVVAHEKDVDRYLTLLEGSSAGLIAVGSRQRLSQARPSVLSTAALDVKTMFDSLRLKEVTAILRRTTGDVPDVPNGLRYRAFLDQAAQVTPTVFQREMRRELKNRTIQNCRPLMLDRSLHPLSALLAQLDPSDRQQGNLRTWLASKER